MTLRHGSDLCLLRRSQRVRSDRGLWHCLTGFLDDGSSAVDQAVRELREETGLHAEADLVELDSAPPVGLRDEAGHLWVVHRVLAVTRTPRIRLNWENDDYRWVRPAAIPGPGQVRWLPAVVACWDPAHASGWAS